MTAAAVAASPAEAELVAARAAREFGAAVATAGPAVGSAALAVAMHQAEAEPAAVVAATSPRLAQVVVLRPAGTMNCLRPGRSLPTPAGSPTAACRSRRRSMRSE